MSIFTAIRLNQVIISLIVGIALGITIGHPLHRKPFHHHRGKGPMQQHMIDRFSKELNLSAGQKQQVAAIFETTRPKMDALQAEVRPKFEALRKETQSEIKKILTPDQQKKMDAIESRMKERMKDMPPPRF